MSFYHCFDWSFLELTTQRTLLKAWYVFPLTFCEPLEFTGVPAPPFPNRKKTAKNKIIAKEMEKWQVKEHMHRGTQQDCWGLIHEQHLCQHHCLWKSKHSTWFCRWSENPRLKPAVFVSCSLYPPGEWGATKSFIPLAFTLSSMSRDLTNIDWQLRAFGSGVLSFFFHFSLCLQLTECAGLSFFSILCLSYVSCSIIQLYVCSSRHTLQSRHRDLVY